MKKLKAHRILDLTHKVLKEIFEDIPVFVDSQQVRIIPVGFALFYLASCSVIET
jgi:hypothetical protein